MSPASIPTHDSLPLLLALPTELKLQIISYLPYDKSPNLACLRRTHRSFCDIIPKSNVYSKAPAFLLRSQLLDTELNHPYLLPLYHYPCYRYIAVLASQKFIARLVQHTFVIGGAYAYYRLCKRCAFKESTPEEKEWKIEAQKQSRGSSSTPDL